jgi:hypothetical protein
MDGQEEACRRLGGKNCFLAQEDHKNSSSPVLSSQFNGKQIGNFYKLCGVMRL